MKEHSFITRLKRINRLTLIQVVILASFFTSGAIFFSYSSEEPSVPITSFLQDWKTEELPFPMPTLEFFAFPSRTCSIDSYGAINDGQTLNTRAIQAAISDCAEKGGGTVLIPAGVFLTGPIHLESHIRLEVSADAELRFSRNFADYLPTVFTRYEGMELYNYSPLIYADTCEDVAITGTGRLNGQGEAWWPWKSRQQNGAKRLYAMANQSLPVAERQFGTPETGLRPSFIQFVHCSRIQVEDVRIENGPMWTVHPLYSENILIRNVKISTAGPNTDGIVLDSSRNALVESVTLDTEDDAIVIKSGVDADGRRVGKCSENIVIRNCYVGEGNSGVALGSETAGDIRNVLVSGCRFDGTKRGLRIKSAPGRGGVVENFWARDIIMSDIQAEAIAINMFYDSKNVVNPTSTRPPIFRNFSFQNISAVGAWVAIWINGSIESPIQNLSFQDVMIQSENGATIENVDTLQIARTHLETRRSPVITANNLRHAHFTEHAATAGKNTELLFTGRKTDEIELDDSYPRSKVRIDRSVPKSAAIWKGQ